MSDPHLPNSVIPVALEFLTRRGGTLSYPEAHRRFLTCSLRTQVAKYKISMLCSWNIIITILIARELFDNVGKIMKFPRRFHTHLHEKVIILNLSIIFFMCIFYFYLCNIFALNIQGNKYKENLFIRYVYLYLKAFDWNIFQWVSHIFDTFM